MRRPRRPSPGADGVAPARPGADTRLWLTWAIVKELGYDPAYGVFADIQFHPTGEPETAFVGMPYAGEGFGAWFPLEVDDTVLVAVPLGDSGWGPVIISRTWNSGDLPPPPTDLDWATLAPLLEPPKDVVIRAKPGRAIKIRGNGANVDIRVESTGDVIIENLGTGKVKLGVAATASPLVSLAQAKVVLAPLLTTFGAVVVTDTALQTAVATLISGLFNGPIGTVKTEAT